MKPASCQLANLHSPQDQSQIALGRAMVWLLPSLAHSLVAASSHESSELGTMCKK